MTTLEKNKMLAHFIAIDKGEFEVLLPKFGWFDERKDKNSSKFLFDVDWNWLMEVVEKISEYRLAYPEQANKVCNLKVVINKDALYNACVEFIEWYNENN